MVTLISKLEDLLVSRGWNVVSRGNDLPWWVDEQWRLRSEWKPRGFVIYLNFLVDPQDDGAVRRGRARPRARRQAKAQVWAVSATTGLPVDRFEAQAGVLAGLKESALAPFVKRLDELRNAAEQSDGAAADGSFAAASR